MAISTTPVELTLAICSITVVAWPFFLAAAADAETRALWAWRPRTDSNRRRAP